MFAISIDVEKVSVSTQSGFRIKCGDNSQLTIINRGNAKPSDNTHDSGKLNRIVRAKLPIVFIDNPVCLFCDLRSLKVFLVKAGERTRKLIASMPFFIVDVPLRIHEVDSH